MSDYEPPDGRYTSHGHYYARIAEALVCSPQKPALGTYVLAVKDAYEKGRRDAEALAAQESPSE
jgi:hypothetical protein